MKELLEIKENGLTLGGKPFYIASGDMHYFRYFKGGWERRLRLMKDFGLTCLQTYVPWDLHEPEKGQFCFSDNLDIAEFLKLCDKIGLKVLLRPSPYMCSEWDFGGLPYWLLKERKMVIRSAEESYMKHVVSYTKRLCKEFVPLLSTNGGPIIAVALENEYGSFGCDREYLEQMKALLKGEGVDVPLYSANGPEMKHMKWGSLPDVWTGIDTRNAVPENAETLEEYQGKKPYMVCEQWAGCAQQWGGVFNRQSPEAAAKNYKKSLDAGFMVNFYMFCGGTNFGFMSGGLYGTYRADVPHAKVRYVPYGTSYDVDAPICEDGRPTEKYYELKKVLCEHLGTPYEEKQYDIKLQAPAKTVLTKSADFFENIDAVTEKKLNAKNVVCMEDIDQAYGYIMYTTRLEYCDDNIRRLIIEGLSDRATVYGNGEYLGTLMRDREGKIDFTIPKEGLTLSILVENMGRMCYGYKMATDRKGINECVHLDRISKVSGAKLHDFSMVMDWEIRGIPLKDLSGINYNSKPNENTPGFYSGSFEAEPGIDTHILLKGWNKGCVYINGFNIGRYWKIGPQETLYIPGELLKKHNTIEVFELYAPNEDKSVEFSERPSLDTIKENVEKLVQAERA